MKKLKMILATLFGCLMMFTSVGCGAKGGGDETEVQFYMWQSGFGVKYMQQLVENFNAKQDKFKVDLETTPNQSSITSTLQSGSSNTYDLYMVPVENQYYEIFECIDDVMNYTCEGESKKISEKILSSALSMKTRSDGKVYDLPFTGSSVGLFYNKQIIDGGEYKVPNTTEELNTLVWDIVNDDAIEARPFVHFQDDGNGYYNYLYDVWVAQYNGLDYHRNIFSKLIGDDGKENTKEVFERKDGRWETLKVLESIITKETVTAASNEQDFTTAQTSLFNGEAVMMVNGTWLKNEMKVSDDLVEGHGVNENIVMMKTPVISSIVDKLEYRKDGKVMSDMNLSKLISAIDDHLDYNEAKATTRIADLSENDYNRVKEARNIMYNSFKGTNFFIPNYSNAIEGAKEFMKYIMSDEGILTFMNETHMASSAELDDPTKLDMGLWTEWDKYHYNLTKEYTETIYDSQDVSKIFYKNQLDSFAKKSFIKSFSAQENVDIKSATTIWQEMLDFINEQWKYWVG